MVAISYRELLESKKAVRELASRASPPTLVQYNQWGERVDDLRTSEGWRGLKELAQREGIPGIFYERKHGEYSRLHGFAKGLLLVADSQDVGMAIFLLASLTCIPDFLPNEHDRWKCQR